MLKALKSHRFESAQIIVIFYVFAILIATGLFCLPVALKPGVDWSFLDALFTAVSAVSVTGLAVVPYVDTFSTTGIFFLMFILQFGGIGIMTLGTFFWLMIGKKIGIKERQLISIDHNRSQLSGLVNVMKQIVLIIFLIEMVGAAILGSYFLQYYPTWQQAYLQGTFASISATTNAGFDLTGMSLIPFAHDYFVQSIYIILLTLGAIGFPVLIEVKDYIKLRKESRPFHFSLYTKLTTVTFFSLMLFGTVVILLIESTHFFVNKSWHEAFFYAFFHSSSTRNGGLATIDINYFSDSTLLVLCFFMFIGASPSSVGGGIRTTTFAILLLLILSFARGKKDVRVFKREIHEEDIKKSVVVTFLALLLCFIATIILKRTETFSLMEIVFEVSSAFGTTGLSTGITPDFTMIGKIILMILMFIGRIGILTFIFLFDKGENNDDFYHYPKERVIVG
ncbi:TrkH family potassium uptake protein [Lederbergia graminis]|uniref:TrkH family potassium uptake protein n=1 Tax=Lederbergia graminis TaxID=735518 RepID=A0ABW0LE21_9BACI